MQYWQYLLRFIMLERKRYIQVRIDRIAPQSGHWSV